MISFLRKLKCTMEVFDSEAMAKAWFNSPVTSLGGRSAIEVIHLQRFTGVELILVELGRIKHSAVS